MKRTPTISVGGITLDTPRFLPVLLGSDAKVYGMARSFHEAYGVSSSAIAKGSLSATANSDIVTMEIVEPGLDDDGVFVDTLLAFADTQPADLPLLLVPCGDRYIKMVIRNQDALRDRYEFEVMDHDLYERLGTKEHFYEICETYGFAYPRTGIATYEDHETIEAPFDFPMIIKPDNSVAYWNCSFPGKKKVFIASSEEEFRAILKAIYGSSYKDSLILQEYIPGDDSGMRVANCYCGKDGKVKLAAVGQVLLEEHSPEGIGSYAAIISSREDEVTERIKAFLEDIGYVGFANFDMKYDPRDGSFKLFEINLRMGRASYYVTAAGYNLATYLVDDILLDKELGYTQATNEVLWTMVPLGVIEKYVQDPALKERAVRLAREGKMIRSMWYPKDGNLKRRLWFVRNQLNYYRKYAKHFGKKGFFE